MTTARIEQYRKVSTKIRFVNFRFLVIHSFLGTLHFCSAGLVYHVWIRPLSNPLMDKAYQIQVVIKKTCFGGLPCHVVNGGGAESGSDL